MTDALIPSVSLEALLAKRDAVAERIRSVLKAATEIQELLAPIEHTGLQARFFASDHRAFDSAEDAEKMIRHVDAGMWDHLLKLSGLWQLMDATARNEWRSNIDKAEVPELTAENVAATFKALHDGRALMFERGVIACFRKLSWHYKTNNPVKLGKRLVLTRAVDGWGGWQYARPAFESTNQLDDLLRVMHILDGKPEPATVVFNDLPWTGSYRTLEAAGWPMREPIAELHGMFTVRGFKNGNAHLTFTRLDLVDKMNAIIAKHYPNALPPAREGKEAA